MKAGAPKSHWIAAVGMMLVLLLAAWPAAGQTCPAPTARQDRVSLPADSGATYQVVVPNPLLNDSSGSGRVLSRQMTLPQGDVVTGLLSAGPEGTLLFTGTRDAVRTRYFSYVVEEEGGGSDEGAIRISEGLDFEAPPSIAADYFAVPQGCFTHSLDVLANDSYPSSSSVTMVRVIYGPNSRGAVTIEGGAHPRLRYQPQPCWSYTGPDEFQYVVRVNGEEYVGLVHVDVNPAPPDDEANPCFNILDPNFALPATTEHLETQRDGVFDLGCSDDGTQAQGPPAGDCWDWGDGTPLSEPPGCAGDLTYETGYVCEGARCYIGRRRVHPYAQLGSYIVRLRVKNPAGVWSDWTGREVTLHNAPPQAVLDPILCTALDCPLHATATDDFDAAASLLYTWDFGDDSPLGAGAGLTHRYPGLGRYPLTLLVTDSQGGLEVQTRTVEVLDRPPVMGFTVSSNCGDRCLGFAATTVDDFGLAGHEWRWRRVADGIAGLLGVTATAELRTALLGLYDVTLTSTDGAGQSGALTQRVLLSGALTAATDWWVLPPGATEVAFDPRANDGPGGGLTITAFGQGLYGAVTSGASGTLRYQLTGPRPGATDHFAYTVTDLAGNTAQGTVHVVTRPIGEVGRAEAVSVGGTSVPLRRDYGATPLVFALPASANDPAPVTVRVSGVKPADFTAQIQAPGGGAHVPESVDYLVIAPPWTGVLGTGWGQLEDGRRFVAGRLVVGQTLAAGLLPDRWVTVSLPWEIGASGLPVVLAQTQSSNDPTWVSARVDQVTATSFRVSLEVPENAAPHGAETVAWVAFPAGISADTSPLLYESVATGAKFAGPFQRLAFARRFPLPPLVLATLSSRNDADPAALRRRFIDVGGVELAVQEDTTRDAETTHGLEAVSLLAFAEPAVLAGATVPFSSATDGGGLLGVDDRFLVNAGKETVLAVLFNDKPGSGTLELLGFTQPVYGRLTRIAPGAPPIGTELPLDNGLDGEIPFGGEFVYQPPTPEFRGWDAFEYTVRDGAGNRATMTVWIEVIGENEQ